MQDLDIRGAGNLLGAEQSGFIMDMGYETYQKILSEAMEELGIESGIRTSASTDFIVECTIETDQLAYIPDDYIDVQAEKLRIYKQLDSMKKERDINSFQAQIKDRFGDLPEPALNLFYVVRMRNIAESLGFEKLIVKNGLFIAFFVSSPMSEYYKSSTFQRVLEKSASIQTLAFKQSEGKLKLVSRGIDSMEKAYALLDKIK